ncbi:hypothetical protein, partial [Aeromonas sp. ZOR0001]|uniref:hypothetical protein n=1 Tax=Aeromonas sp. ZOR0001 TaxID=1339227 RepID=UPI001E2F48F6
MANQARQKPVILTETARQRDELGDQLTGEMKRCQLSVYCCQSVWPVQGRRGKSDEKTVRKGAGGRP